jgi:myo-inositol-1(or 4)-monophosphatase
VGNFTGESDFLHQRECLAANPRIYGQLVGLVGKYSRFASAGDKAAVRDTLQQRPNPTDDARDGASDDAGNGANDNADAPF